MSRHVLVRIAAAGPDAGAGAAGFDAGAVVLAMGSAGLVGLGAAVVLLGAVDELGAVVVSDSDAQPARATTVAAMATARAVLMRARYNDR